MKIAIDGMHCQACVERVRKALEKVAGVEVQQVDVGSARVIVAPAHESAVLEAVRRAGFEPRQSE